MSKLGANTICRINLKSPAREICGLSVWFPEKCLLEAEGVGKRII